MIQFILLVLIVIAVLLIPIFRKAVLLILVVPIILLIGYCACSYLYSFYEDSKITKIEKTYQQQVKIDQVAAVSTPPISVRQEPVLPTGDGLSLEQRINIENHCSHDSKFDARPPLEREKCIDRESMKMRNYHLTKRTTSSLASKIETARKSGYSDTEILDYLKKSNFQIPN